MDLVPLDGDEAEVDRVLVVGSEVTKQVAIRLELAAEQARLRAVLQNIPLGVVVVDNACRVVLANAAAEELGPLPGFSSGQSVGYLELACCPEAGGSHSPVELACIRTVQEGESYGNEEMAVPGPGGRARHLLVSAAPILDRHGRSEGGVAVFQDISERKKAQEDLRQYADRLQILHRTDQAILEAQSAEEVIAPILPCLQRLVPYKWAGVTWFDWEAGEMSMLDVYPGGGDGPGRGWRGLLQWAWFLEQLEEEGMYLAEDVHDGLPSGPLTEALEDVGVRGYAALPIAIQGKLVGALGVGLSRPGRLATDQIEILRDVANELAIGLHQVRLQQQLQRHTQELGRSVARRTAALRESQARLRAIFEDAAMGIALAREDGRLVESNPALQRMLGYSAEELQGMRFAEFTHPEDVRADLDRFEELLAGERDHYQLQKRYIRKDGRTVWVNLTVSLIQFPRDLQRLAVGIVEDITEKKRAQEALIQAEKLTVTGRLAASLAHEINNPLQAVIGCMDLAERAMVEGGDVERYMQVARHELRRAARVVAQLRDLHRQPKERVREPTDVNAVMERVLTVSTQQLQRGRVQLDWCGADELPALIATPDQLEQVFLNLVLNAIDAMPRGGELQVRTARTWQPDGIAVRVADTGIGIAPDVLPQLFEPFHSTRIEGLGLGLYVSRNIVEGHGGHIDVVSEPGRGATFTVWLPLQGHPTG
jgi:PAS domain S-box-containing protein